MNVKFLISYDGSLYKGSQKQPDKNTIEDKLLDAFKRINIERVVFHQWLNFCHSARLNGNIRC